MSKLNIRQTVDSNECEQMQEQGMDKDCMECSCMVCLAQEPTDLVSGLELATSIVAKEIEVAREVNSQMALGMSQILMLLDNELNKCKTI